MLSASPLLLLTPRPTKPPTISGTAAIGATLTCSTGEWAGDLIGANLYRAPHDFSFQWTRNGTAIPGATSSAFQADSTGGDFRCEVSAHNAAGAGTQTSEAIHVVGVVQKPTGFGSDPKVTLSVKATRIGASGALDLSLANHNAFAVSVTLAATAPGPRGRTVKLKPLRFTLAANQSRSLNLKLASALRSTLRTKGRLRLKLTASLQDPAGAHRTLAKTVLLKAAGRR